MLPVLENTPSLPKDRVPCGETSRFTPPAMAASASPSRRARTAWWMDTSEEEHAVSTVVDGPRKSKA